jgi:ribosomal-protein-alanine N-acetyltransferase
MVGQEGLIFSALKEGDLDEVAVLEQACFSMPWSKALFQEELKHPDLSTWRVARKGPQNGGPILAYMGYWKAGDEAHIVNLAVHPDWRRQGLGEAMAGHVLALAASTGCRSATLEARAGNAAALALYEKLGFTAVALRPRYYSDNQEDAVILWKRDLGRITS